MADDLAMDTLAWIVTALMLAGIMCAVWGTMALCAVLEAVPA